MFSFEEALLTCVEVPMLEAAHQANGNGFEGDMSGRDGEQQQGVTVFIDTGAGQRGRKRIGAFHSVNIIGKIRHLDKFEAMFECVGLGPTEEFQPMGVETFVMSVRHVKSVTTGRKEKQSCYDGLMTDLQINNDVLIGIAHMAMQEVKGVEPVTPSLNVSEVLTGRKAQGLKVERNGSEVSVQVTLVVHYGYIIRDVCEQVQTAIGSNIEAMTGLKVKAVHVNVQSIVIPRGA